MAASDAQLMSRYCDGDREAFRELYALVAPPLFRYLLRLSGDRSMADDLLQLTFLKAHRARSAYVRGARPLPWLHAIARRSYLDEVRRRKRSRVGLHRDPDTAAEPAASVDGRASPEAHGAPGRIAAQLAERHADSELASRAVAALDALPPNQREALILTKLNGRSIAEAAAITGASPGAIKLRVHRGYQALRKALATEEGAP